MLILPSDQSRTNSENFLKDFHLTYCSHIQDHCKYFRDSNQIQSTLFHNSSRNNKDPKNLIALYLKERLQTYTLISKRFLIECGVEVSQIIQFLCKICENYFISYLSLSKIIQCMYLSAPRKFRFFFFFRLRASFQMNMQLAQMARRIRLVFFQNHLAMSLCIDIPINFQVCYKKSSLPNINSRRNPRESSISHEKYLRNKKQKCSGGLSL